MGASRRPRAPVPFVVRWLDEETPGAAFLEQFNRAWPSYRSWFLKEGDAARPDLETARGELGRHMPELVPLFEELVALTGGDPLVARMLSLYRPAPYLMACSQAVWSNGAPLLVRNYDYHPSGCEGVFLRSSWTGRTTLVATDCLWGVLDGVNDRGLAVSLAFGGRREVGDGFGIPLILRYVLETAATTRAAEEILRRVPSHMSYNVSLLDAAGERSVVAVAPDRSASVQRTDVATNHQAGPRWEAYVRKTRSVERLEHLAAAASDSGLSAERFIGRFLRPPLYTTQYDRARGTLYTVAYRPATGEASYRWPALQVDASLASCPPRVETIPLGASR